MKKVIFALFLIFFVIYPSIAGENYQHTINWKGIQKWSVKDQFTTVLSFDEATYPDGSLLPHFFSRMGADKDFTYHVSIVQPVYEELSSAETAIVKNSGIQLTQEVVLQTSILTQRLQNYLNIDILPFIIKEDKVYRLTAFTINIEKEKRPAKVSNANLHTYTENSVLAQGKFVKIRIAESGVYKLTYEDLNAMGLSPANVRIYGYGGAVLEQDFKKNRIDDLPEVAVYMNKGSDGVFNAGDYILFYAQGVNKWTYNPSSAMFVHSLNSYSTYGYYFVTSGTSEGKRIQNSFVSVPSSATVYPVDEFVDYQVYEKELKSLINSGKEFYGEPFETTAAKSFKFTSPNVKTTFSSVKARLSVASASSLSSYFTFSLNGSQTYNLSVGDIGDKYEHAKASTGTFTFKPVSDNLDFILRYSLPGTSSVGYLNYIELNTRRLLKMSGAVMPFQNVDYYGTDTYSRFSVSNAGTNVQIWDITNQLDIKSITAEIQNGNLTFYGSNAQVYSYLSIDPTNAAAFSKPEIVGNVSNQNLHGLALADMIILTAPEFVKQAQELADAHRNIDHLTVHVVTTEQVYNEFSSGTPDATAYRWLMKMFYDRAKAQNNTADMPKYLLLFGKGSYDNRKLLKTSGVNYILTYQTENSLHEISSYVTDDYFGLLDDNEGADVPIGLLDIGIGRFPVSNTDEADVVVTKTISYMKNERKGMWKNQLCFVADDGDNALHMSQADMIASNVANKFSDYQVNKIFLDAYNQVSTASGEYYPVARTQLLNNIQNGLLLLNYTGHASENGWTNESILLANDVMNLSNKNLPLWIGATCDFLQFDNQAVSAGEQVLLNPSGGGIGIISAARPVYAYENMTFDKQICDNLFRKANGEHFRLGDVFSLAKNNAGININRLSYVFMGDPALKLNYPTKYKVVTSEIKNRSNVVTDTLKALSVVSVKGYIADDSGNVVTGFNGVVSVNVYDKIQSITTLNNDRDGAMTYFDRPNVLFSGKAEAKDGWFTIEFMLPKDIKYNYGGGRMNYYAYDYNNNENEAQGTYENFIVGGSDSNIQYETEGPEIKTGLNNYNFVSGGKVNETPLFMAQISDISGVNRVGSGIGHDLLLTIDDDPNQVYILNDYYQTDFGSYTSGNLKFRMPELSVGKHSLKFRAWDLLNNSSTVALNFEVVKNLAPEIFDISNYPNPVKTYTNIAVNYDRPETILDTRVEIFDVSGRKVWSFTQTNADEIKWDVTSMEGVKVKTGIYLYRVTVTTGDKEVHSGMKKMVVIEQ